MCISGAETQKSFWQIKPQGFLIKKATFIIGRFFDPKFLKYWHVWHMTKIQLWLVSILQMNDKFLLMASSKTANIKLKKQTEKTVVQNVLNFYWQFSN